jgi:dihydrofolate synthase / folylpolyglutamate synthase
MRASDPVAAGAALASRPGSGEEAAARRSWGLQEWLDWQTRLHPSAIELGLERVAAVWQRLAPKRLACPVIAVGGTNGKGSCVAMIEAMALAAGYRCVSYTSPHLLAYNERVRISGEPVTDERLCGSFERVEEARQGTPLTYFEFGTLAALDICASEQTDLAILEVGLGGRLDAVNIIDADAAVVTSIGRDHTAWLGETLDEIAVEKAGIFRAGRPAIIGQRDAPAALRRRAEEIGACPLELGREVRYEEAAAGWSLSLPDGARLALPHPRLRGGFQLDNAAAAVTALRALAPVLPLPVSAIRSGLQRALLPGRFQVVPGAVTLVLDVAHNGAAAQSLAENLRALACSGRLAVVMAVLSDKIPEEIAGPIEPFVQCWHLAQSDDPRAMPVSELVSRLGGVIGAAPVQTCASVELALDTALADARPGDCVLVLGSFTTVAQALRHYPRIGGSE